MTTAVISCTDPEEQKVIRQIIAQGFIRIEEYRALIAHARVIASSTGMSIIEMYEALRDGGKVNMSIKDGSQE